MCYPVLIMIIIIITFATTVIIITIIVVMITIGLYVSITIWISFMLGTYLYVQTALSHISPYHAHQPNAFYHRQRHPLET